jgi:hypothetical protein
MGACAADSCARATAAKSLPIKLAVAAGNGTVNEADLSEDIASELDARLEKVARDILHSLNGFAPRVQGAREVSKVVHHLRILIEDK